MTLRGFQERKMLRKVIFSAPMVFVVWGIILWMLWNTIVLWDTKIKINNRNEDIETEIENSEESRKIVEQKMESLRSEYGIDLEARSKFNLTKSGEKVVVFADESNKNESLPKTKNPFTSFASLLADFFNFLKNEE